MPPTTTALVTHLQAVNTSADGMTAEKIMRSLFTAAWTKEGWATGSADGQSLVVEPAEVRQAQDALKKLNYAPGPIGRRVRACNAFGNRDFPGRQRHECYGPAHPQHVSKRHRGP